jgi:S-methylmethionine-dependent homocysteine/selenocysteine methylase
MLQRLHPPDTSLIKSVTILDGGTGRELKAIGAPFQQPEWSALALIQAPHFVQLVHESYLNVGADIITTNSYAVCPFHIGEERFLSSGKELAELAGKLALAAVTEQVKKCKDKPCAKIAGSLPPTGGSYRADLFDVKAGKPILETLVKGLAPYVNIWLAETLSAIAEAQLVCDVISMSGFDKRPIWLSFTLLESQENNDSPKLRSGESVREAAEKVKVLGVQAMLFNCSQPEVMDAAVQVARSVLPINIEIGVYANAFEPQKQDATANSGYSILRDDTTPENYRKMAEKWVLDGATIIGGCCGIGPAHISMLSGISNIKK